MKEKQIKVNLKENSYSVVIGKGVLNNCGKKISKLKLGKKFLIVTQTKVPKKYIAEVKKSLLNKGYKVFVYTLPSGEQYKNLESLTKIIRFAVKNKFERKDTFISIGGGVTSDLTGFAASIYYRGLNFISIPTTLLGMVDAAIGGKTSTNIKEGKNLIGTFYQPKTVLIDPSTLKTLPKKEFLIGMAEVLKYAFIEKTAKTRFRTSSFFNYLQKNKKQILNLQEKSLTEIIYHSAKVKASVVSKDEKESNLRAILNLGHTFAHGIEQAYNYKKYTHGEAVSIGTCYAAILSEEEGFITAGNKNKIISLIESYGLPTKLPKGSKYDQIVKSMLLDKKVENGKLKFILPSKEIGNVKIISGIDMQKVKKLIKSN